MVTGLLPGDDLAMAAIGQLYGTTPVDGAVDLEAFQSVLRAAVARLLDVVAARAPTVVCLQDLHWVDPSTATLVRDLVGTHLRTGRHDLQLPAGIRARSAE